MKITIGQKVGIGIGLILVLASFFLLRTDYFLLVIGVGIIIAISPFVFVLIEQAKIEAEKEEMFLEFTRNLVESVKTGTPISKSILNAKNKPYGILGPHVKKLANQISIGISLNYALQVFAKDVDNKTVSRTIGLIGQAERAGGNIEQILEVVAEAVTTTDKLKKERKSAVSTLVFQGYIIFLIFTAIILLMQFKIIPLLSGISGMGDLRGGIETSTSGAEKPSLSGEEVGDSTKKQQEEISSSFLYLLLVQGFFTGLTIGMLSEGSLKAGVKHSFALMLISFFISAGSNVLFG